MANRDSDSEDFAGWQPVTSLRSRNDTVLEATSTENELVFGLPMTKSLQIFFWLRISLSNLRWLDISLIFSKISNVRDLKFLNCPESLENLFFVSFVESRYSYKKSSKNIENFWSKTYFENFSKCFFEFFSKFLKSFLMIFLINNFS